MRCSLVVSLPFLAISGKIFAKLAKGLASMATAGLATGGMETLGWDHGGHDSCISGWTYSEMGQSRVGSASDHCHDGDRHGDSFGTCRKWGSRKRTYQDIGIFDGFLVGCGQMIALLPGASRSGSTLTTALFLGLERQTAARFSFLLGIPTLTIATLVQAKDVFDEGTLFIPLVIATLSSMVFSYLAIAWLLRFLQRHSTWVFIWYRIGLGTALWGAIAFGSLRP